MVSQTTPIIPNKKVWTIEDARVLAELGFPGADKLELVAGELINRMGKKHLHVLFQVLVMNWLQTTFGHEYVRSESPVGVSMGDSKYNEPEPDLMVTAESIRRYTSTPLPEDVLLAVEISDSTLAFDLTVKAALYARAGIAEYWVIDIVAKRVVVHRWPKNGAYSSVQTFSSDETIAPIAAPTASFCLDRI